MIPVIDLGTYARYPKTGTIGTVIGFQEQNGQTFAELDSTGLLYRIDLLTVASKEEKASAERTTRADDIKKVLKERESLGDTAYAEAVFQQDGACHGGG